MTYKFSRPAEIFVLLGKISDGTILNEKEYGDLEKYIRELEAVVSSEFDEG